MQSGQPYQERSPGVRKEDLDSYSARYSLGHGPLECPNALYHFSESPRGPCPHRAEAAKNTISGSVQDTLDSAHCHGPIFEGGLKMGPCLRLLGSVEMSDPGIALPDISTLVYTSV